ncbi:Histone chaperone asf1 [Coemansia erecta]|uniref:Histone chaperone n=1 Tax=Coemansia erecta TaxID=147472 RepID=A0A9W7Y5H2_9FUNG|nr:Histone chaperone asf1 [Coemansia erecta]
MSVVQITNVNILVPESHFLAPYKFEITFECLSPLDDDLEFKLIYVSSPKNKKLDQELDSLLVGPVPVGVNKFVFEADAPKIDKIPKEDVIGVTVILLSCSYKDKEFVRIGYYVDNMYNTEELQANPPEVPILDKIFRRILTDKPRVTRFPINWEDPHKVEEPPVQKADGDMDEEMEDDTADKDEIANGSEDDEEDSDSDDEGEDEDANAEIDLAMMEEQDEGVDESDEENGIDEDGDEDMATDDMPSSSSGFVGSAVPQAVISGSGMEVE